jgi:hypothetical protein
MVSFNAGGREFTHELIGKNRSETVFEVALVVESRGGEVSLRTIELDVSSRDDLTVDRPEPAIEDWQQDQPTPTIERLVVRETQRCGFGELVDPEEEGEAEREAPLYRGGTQARPRARNPYEVGFGDVPVDQGEEVEFHIAGPDTSVYGTGTGTATGVKTGTDEYDVLIVETDSGTKRVREDGRVGHGEDEEEADDEADDAQEQAEAEEDE